MAASLARHHQLDEQRAAQAGLLHDVAKFFKPKRLLEMARAEGLELDPVEEANPHLLHADVGAIVARDEFGVCDEEILQAVRNHTLGRPGMSFLSCVVFLADSLEPGRGNTSQLEHLRQLSWQDLYSAVWQTCDYSIQHLIVSRRLIHPRAVLTRNWAMEMARKEGKQVEGEG
jgi:predicted HD superfamily hydrolase involved in NAD metabolism